MDGSEFAEQKKKKFFFQQSLKQAMRLSKNHFELDLNKAEDHNNNNNKSIKLGQSCTKTNFVGE